MRRTIIRAIEQDDYSPCGGDFSVRGHIRAIARVVGADPAPLPPFVHNVSAAGTA